MQLTALSPYTTSYHFLREPAANELVDLFLPIALILVGLMLIVIEVYLIPGFNVIGIMGVLLVIGAIMIAFSEGGAMGGLAALGGSVIAVGGLFWFLYSSGAWDRFVLTTSLKRDPDEAEEDRDQRRRYLGKRGVAVTPLRPGGVVEIDGERVEVSTEGEFIAAGSDVRVVAMDRRRYFVRLAEPMSENTVSES